MGSMNCNSQSTTERAMEMSVKTTLTSRPPNSLSLKMFLKNFIPKKKTELVFTDLKRGLKYMYQRKVIHFEAIKQSNGDKK
jgi:hypothetical protein